MKKEGGLRAEVAMGMSVRGEREGLWEEKWCRMVGREREGGSCEERENSGEKGAVAG